MDPPPLPNPNHPPPLPMGGISEKRPGFLRRWLNGYPYLVVPITSLKRPIEICDLRPIKIRQNFVFDAPKFPGILIRGHGQQVDSIGNLLLARLVKDRSCTIFIGHPPELRPIQGVGHTLRILQERQPGFAHITDLSVRRVGDELQVVQNDFSFSDGEPQGCFRKISWFAVSVTFLALLSMTFVLIPIVGIMLLFTVVVVFPVTSSNRFLAFRGKPTFPEMELFCRGRAAAMRKLTQDVLQQDMGIDGSAIISC